MKRTIAGAVVLALAAGATGAGVSRGLDNSSTKVLPLNPGVSQGNIDQTICVPGWTTTIRPPASYTNKLKADQIAKLPPDVDHDPASYEEDHAVSLTLGGDPRDPRNLWLQPIVEARAWDPLETALSRAVCNGAISLAEAQRFEWKAKGR